MFSFVLFRGPLDALVIGGRVCWVKARAAQGEELLEACPWAEDEDEEEEEEDGWTCADSPGLVFP